MSGLLRNRWLWVIVVVLVIGGGVFLAMRANAQSSTRTTTQTSQVTRGQIQSAVLSSAALQPAADLTLTFGASGTITAVKVKPGDVVTKGQVLAQLDPTSLNMAVVQAQANLQSAQAKLDQLKAGPTVKDLTTAQTNLASAQAKLAALKAPPTAADLANAQASLKSAQAKLASVK